VLVGINLLREGLDLPEVSLVAILDADKEGYLRSSRSLVQTIGRAARNLHGTVIMYADTVTDSMQYALDETARRRRIQQAHNEAHGIVPRTIQKAVGNRLVAIAEADYLEPLEQPEDDAESWPDADEIPGLIDKLRKEMRRAAAALEFEEAAGLRDRMHALERHLLGLAEARHA